MFQLEGLPQKSERIRDILLLGNACLWHKCKIWRVRYSTWGWGSNSPVLQHCNQAGTPQDKNNEPGPNQTGPIWCPFPSNFGQAKTTIVFFHKKNNKYILTIAPWVRTWLLLLPPSHTDRIGRLPSLSHVPFHPLTFIPHITKFPPQRISSGNIHLITHPSTHQVSFQHSLLCSQGRLSSYGTLL